MSDQELAEAPAQEGEVVEQDVHDLDPETRARRDAALSHIRKFGDPVLRARAIEVDRFDDALRAEIDRMGELMHDALGVGLAATQLGVLSRVLVYQAHAEDPLTALVNPVIEWSSEAQAVAEEGCLSIPGYRSRSSAPTEVHVRAQDPTGDPITVRAEGLAARVIQHEVDHLDGILMLDRIPRERRRDAMRALREGRSAERGAGEAGREREAGAERETGAGSEAGAERETGARSDARLG